MGELVQTLLVEFQPLVDLLIGQMNLGKGIFDLLLEHGVFGLQGVSL